MRNRSQTFTSDSQKKTYQPPRLIPLGSVQQLTLKLGSISDGMGPHQQ